MTLYIDIWWKMLPPWNYQCDEQHLIPKMYPLAVSQVGPDRLWIFGADANTDIEEQENYDIQYTK